MISEGRIWAARVLRPRGLQKLRELPYLPGFFFTISTRGSEKTLERALRSVSCDTHTQGSIQRPWSWVKELTVRFLSSHRTEAFYEGKGAQILCRLDTGEKSLWQREEKPHPGGGAEIPLVVMVRTHLIWRMRGWAVISWKGASKHRPSQT